MSEIKVAGHQVWCPLCEEHVQLLGVHTVAKLLDVNRRTLYRYIEQGGLHAVKVAGKTYSLRRTVCVQAACSERTLKTPARSSSLVTQSGVRSARIECSLFRLRER